MNKTEKKIKDRISDLYVLIDSKNTKIESLSNEVEILIAKREMLEEILEKDV